MSGVVRIESRDYWFKIVEHLQQNWALVDTVLGENVLVHFIGDGSGVFDELRFPSARVAVNALRSNGFRRFAEDPDASDVLSPPPAPFHKASHPNGPIYSSGRYWS